MRQKIVALLWPSGSGKSTQEKLFIEQWFVKPTNYTTRDPRPTDVGYEYISPEEFLEKRSQGLIPVHTEIYGNYYGFATSDDPKVIYVVDGNGLVQLQQFCEEKKSELFSVFLALSPDECKTRMIARGDPSEKIQQRLLADADLNYTRAMCTILVDARKSILEVFNEIDILYQSS